MDPQLVQLHLAEAERHVAHCDETIARQIKIIEQLERSGNSTVFARDVLATYHVLRAAHVAHRDHIRKELER